MLQFILSKIYAKNGTLRNSNLSIFIICYRKIQFVSSFNKALKFKVIFAYVLKFQKFRKEISRYEREEI